MQLEEAEHTKALFIVHLSAPQDGPSPQKHNASKSEKARTAKTTCGLFILFAK